MNVPLLKKRFFDTAVADSLRAVDGRALMGSCILALCVLDYLSALRDKKPTEGNRVNYTAFVDDELAKVNSAYRGGDIYWLRCALVHTYATADASKHTTIRKYAVVHRVPGAHLNPKGPPDVLQINVDTFVADVIIAADAWLDSVVGDPGVEKRADDLLIVQAVSNLTMVARPYASFHRALVALDTVPLNLATLRSAITAVYPS
jgi:hypothetical protein